jgi:hypothetical protein
VAEAPWEASSTLARVASRYGASMLAAVDWSGSAGG